MVELLSKREKEELLARGLSEKWRLMSRVPG